MHINVLHALRALYWGERVYQEVSSPDLVQCRIAIIQFRPYKVIVHQQIIMRSPILKYLLASNLCIQRETPPDRTPPDYTASVEYFSEAG
jgi:hypothetical protein